MFVIVKRCCESNCARVALETSEFCSFHQPKHCLAGRTASIKASERLPHFKQSLMASVSSHQTWATPH
jgi:hypothetical protein